MKQFVYLFSALTIAAGSILSSCDTTPKEDAENKETKDAVVIEEKTDEVTVRVATDEEWAAFKTDAQAKIDANEKRIAELKVKLKKPGKVLDKMYENRIETLQQRNSDLRAKINAYEVNKTGWDKFKEEFNHDVDELGKAIDDIFTDNK